MAIICILLHFVFVSFNLYMLFFVLHVNLIASYCLELFVSLLAP